MKGRELRILCGIIVVLQYITEISTSNTLYVDSVNGVDTSNCQLSNQPCLTLSYAYSKAENEDLLLITGEFTIPSTIEVQKKLNISSWYENQPALVECAETPSSTLPTVGVAFDILTTSTLHNLKITKCSKAAIYVYLQNPNQMVATLSELQVFGNVQGIYVYQSGLFENKITIENSQIYDNSPFMGGKKRMEEKMTSTTDTKINGAGIASMGSVLLLRNISVFDNFANGNGGGLYTIGGQIYTEGITVYGNEAAIGGGWYGEMVQLYITNASITSNFAAGEGGGMYVESSQLDLLDSKFEYNVAKTSGGGIQSRYGWFNATNSGFRNNQANTLNGGAFSAYQTTTWTLNTTWTNNNAFDQGGAMYLDDCTAMLNISTLIANNAEQGGALYSEMTSLMMWNASFIQNWALNGGAAFLESTTYVMWNSTARSNMAKQEGGAWMSQGSTMVVYNTTCTENKSYGSASVAYIEGTTVVFTNVSFNDNVVVDENLSMSQSLTRSVDDEKQQDIVCLKSSVNIYELDLEISEIPVTECLLQCELLFVWEDGSQEWVCQQSDM